MDSLSVHRETLKKLSQVPLKGLAYLQQKKKQLLVIAHSKGIKIYNCNKKQFEDANITAPVNALTVSDDLVFYAQGTQIGAIGYNGKNIFELNTYIASQKINQVHVSGYQLWVITGAMINKFILAGSQLINKATRNNPSPVKQNQDKHSRVFESDINDSILYEEQLEKSFLILLKNSNQIVGYDQKQLFSLKVVSPPLCICQYSGEKYKNRYLVGCAGGEIYCIEVSQSSIKQKWKITQNASTKIRSIRQVKNQNFFVFREESIEIWGPDQTLLAKQQTQVKDKIVTSIYLHHKQVMFCGSASGNILQIGDYTAMMKDFKQKNKKVDQQHLQKQIGNLQRQFNELKMKLEMNNKKNPIQSVSFKVRDSLSVDYTNLCYALQLSSQDKICKIILRGQINVIKNNRITFQGTQKDDTKAYVIEQQNINNSVILFQKQETYSHDSKLKVIVYVKINDKIYGVTKFLQMRPMIYHHKISEVQLTHANTLSIGGSFKYFEMNMWLSAIFNDFGSPNDTQKQYYEACYESILTKQKIKISYKNSECIIRSESPTPLVIIKKFLSHKSKQKHTSFNISVQLEKQTILKMLDSLQNTLKQFQKLRQEYQLLPALMQLKNDQTLSDDLRKILERSDEIKNKYENINTKHKILLDQLSECFISYQKLKDNELGQYQLDNFKRQLRKFNKQVIAACILK